jgi:hypothetical protein
MSEGGTPFSTKNVAPPARMDCPPMSLSNKSLRRCMKKDQVGTEPFALNQRAEWKCMSESREARYALKCRTGSIMDSDRVTRMVFPVKKPVRLVKRELETIIFLL